MSRITGLTPILAQKSMHFDFARLAISDGVCNQGGIQIGPRKYREIAYLPRGHWRAPTPMETARLLPEQPQVQDRQFIGLFKIPDALLHAAWDEGLAAAKTEEEATAAVHKLESSEFLHALVDELSSYLESPEDIHLIGFGVGAPGLPTTAVDPVELAGLHVDDWDKKAVRSQARNRMCINFGREARYFLFVDHPVHMLFDTDRPIETTRGTRVVNEFMDRDPSLPVIRIRLEPGEGYIAPTDNIIHDGSTLGKIFPDVSFHLLGYIARP